MGLAGLTAPEHSRLDRPYPSRRRLSHVPDVAVQVAPRRLVPDDGRCGADRSTHGHCSGACSLVCTDRLYGSTRYLVVSESLGGLFGYRFLQTCLGLASALS